MTTNEAIEQLHSLAADTTQSPENRAEILLKIDKVQQLQQKLEQADFMQKMEIQDSINTLLNISYERPSDSLFECEGCGS